MPTQPHGKPTSLCPGGQRPGLWALPGPRRAETWAVSFARTLVPLSISTAMGCSGTGWDQGTPKQIRAPQNRSGQQAEPSGPPPALVAPRNIYLYQVEQLHQEKHQFRPGWGVFGSVEPVGRGSSDTPGGPCHHVGASCPCSALCGGVQVSQARVLVPMGHPQHPELAAGTSGC